jgi:hypothetical protein
MIRRLLGLCEGRHGGFTEVRCRLRHGHAGDHRFGIVNLGGRLTMDLDYPIRTVRERPTEPATPVHRPYGGGHPIGGHVAEPTAGPAGPSGCSSAHRPAVCPHCPDPDHGR